MHERYQPNFAALTTDEARLAWSSVVYAGLPLPPLPPDVDGPELFERCRGTIHQADVVLSMARRDDLLALSTLEKLVGHPIVRRLPPPPASPIRPRLGRPRSLVTGSKQRQDRREVSAISANPKRPGTKAHERFALYEVGKTVRQLLEAGLTVADIKWDTDRGYVSLVAPSTP
jgi:hypothetical protein